MAESMPDWNEFKRIVQREIDRYYGCGATLMALEVWEPEGTLKYKRKPRKKVQPEKSNTEKLGGLLKEAGLKPRIHCGKCDVTHMDGSECSEEDSKDGT